jgi:hypothetical protein
MPATYYLVSGASDLSGGANFTKLLSQTAETVSTLAVTITKGTTETDYGFTAAGDPNNADWQTGTITVKIYVTSGSTYIWGSVGADRVGPTGTVIEVGNTSGEQQMTNAGAYTFTIASKDWTAGNATDRLRIRYNWRNTRSNGTAGVTFRLGTTDAQVTTSLLLTSTKTPITKDAQYAVQSTHEIAGATGCRYYKDHVVTGSSDGAKTGYPIRLTIVNTDDADSGNVIHTGGNCSAWPYDVEFYNDTTKLDYYRESDNGTTQNVWVEVNVPASPDTVTIRVKYGQADHADDSNGDNTFPLFDHFDGASLDTDKWNVVGPTYIAQSGGIVTINTTAANQAYFYSKNSYGPYGYGVRCNGKVQNTTTAMAVAGFAQTGGNYVVVNWYGGSSNDRVFGTAEANGGTWTQTPDLTGKAVYHTYYIEWISSSLVRFAQDDGTQSTFSTNIPTVACIVDAQPWNASSQLMLDYMFLYQTTEHEPTHTSTGNEVDQGASGIGLPCTYSVFNDGGVIHPTPITKNAKYAVLKVRNTTLNARYAVKVTKDTTLNDRYAVLKPRSLTLNDKYAMLKARNTTLNDKYAVLKTIAITKNLAYRFVTHPTAITKNARYVVKAARAVTKNLAYRFVTHPAAITKNTKYAVKVTNSTTKNAKYAVKIATSVTLNAKYGVKVTSVITKNLTYDVLVTNTHETTRDAKYAVLKTMSMTKNLAYRFVTHPTAITKNDKYVVKATRNVTKNLTYRFVTHPAAITKNAKYAVKAIKAATKDAKYAVKTTRVITKNLEYVIQTEGTYAIGKNLQYAVKTTKSTTKNLSYRFVTVKNVTKNSRYAVKAARAVTKNLAYRFVTHPAAITKNTKYAVKVAHAVTKNLAYMVETIHATAKNDKYAVKVTKAQTKDSKYAVKTIKATTKDAEYAIRTQASVQKDAVYRVIFTRHVELGLQYEIMGDEVTRRTDRNLTYRIGSQHAIAKSLKYVVIWREVLELDGHISKTLSLESAVVETINTPSVPTLNMSMESETTRIMVLDSEITTLLSMREAI